MERLQWCWTPSTSVSGQCVSLLHQTASLSMERRTTWILNAIEARTWIGQPISPSFFRLWSVARQEYHVPFPIKDLQQKCNERGFSATPQWRASSIAPTSTIHHIFVRRIHNVLRCLSDRFAVVKAFRPFWLHVKMHWLRGPMNSPYSWLFSVAASRYAPHEVPDVKSSL